MKHIAFLLAGFALSAASLQAQSKSNNVPESHKPPPGMCRIWIDGVPPTHQPAPTDCATAIRKRPLNARVVFGNDANGNDRNVAPPPSKQSNFVQPVLPSHEDQDRASQQQRDEQDRQRVDQQREAQLREAQRQREEQEKQHAPAASHAPPPSPPHTQERTQERPPERVAPQRPRTEKSQRPPRSSFSSRRPG